MKQVTERGLELSAPLILAITQLLTKDGKTLKQAMRRLGKCDSVAYKWLSQHQSPRLGEICDILDRQGFELVIRPKVLPDMLGRNPSDE